MGYLAFLLIAYLIYSLLMLVNISCCRELNYLQENIFNLSKILSYFLEFGKIVLNFCKCFKSLAPIS